MIGRRSMRSMSEILEEQSLYFYRNGRPTEADFSINDLNRELVAAMKEEHGSAFLGRIHRTSSADISSLTEYTGQVIENFAYDFCVPADDAGLKMILESLSIDGKAPDLLNRVDNLYRRISALGGHLLLWA